MTRAEIEAAAAEKYPLWTRHDDAQRYRQEAYIQGRLDQAEADAQIADAEGHNWSGHPAHSMFGIAAAIREGVE